MSIIQVVWVDSGVHIDHGWAEKKKYLEGTGIENMVVTTVGILMHLDDDIVMVGLSHDEANDTWYGAQVIAMSNVVDITTLVPEEEGQ